MTAGFGSALARATAHGGKMHYKSNILSMDTRCTVLQRELNMLRDVYITDDFYAYCGPIMMY
jgi:hypothetical protein